ncbi:MAG: molecular chaperone HtpG [Gammaproteobacteria bacterium]|nr:molecular chaperone HtpG [Gammaproteobacteria bacterium]
MSTATPAKETHKFQTEVNQLLKLMIHSLYSNQEIFLRELISNASDACDKLRFEALTDDALMESDSELKIRIAFDKEANTVSLSDNGIGMSRDEVIANIGTIANSGTQKFLESLSGDQAKDANMIGQFGVGFYSAFVVADRVTLTTRRAGTTEAVCWDSTGNGEYTLEAVERDSRGTEVVLHLREESSEFADGWRLRSIIKKYSDHITFPVVMLSEPAPAAEGEEAEEPKDETINDASALWTRSKNEISDDEYKAFYKHVSHDFEDPLLWSHSRVEGKLEYTSLLYIPSKAPFDLWERDTTNGIKLFVQRVFIMDDAEKLLPRYLRFVRGLVDSSDLPLNVSREILQSNKVIDSIRTGSVKKVLGMLKKTAKKEPELYQSFWDQFGQVIKEGPGEDFANREEIASLLRFSSTHEDVEKQSVSLDAYIERMKEGQEKIYYITADSFAAAKNSPHLELLRKKEIEVLLMSDRVDEWMMSFIQEYAGKKLVSVAKGALDLDEIETPADKEVQEATEERAKGLLERITTALGDQVEEVKVSHRLTSSPSCLVLKEQDMALHMQQLMKQAGHDLPDSKPTLEINPTHPVLEHMNSESDDAQFGEWASLLLDQAVLAEGGSLKDPAGFVQRLNGMLMTLSKS